MNVGIFLNYIGLGSNLLHLSYCHEIAKKYGPVTIITLCENLNEVLKKDPKIEKVIYLNKYYKKMTDIFDLSNFLAELNIDNAYKTRWIWYHTILAVELFLVIMIQTEI